MGGLGKNPNHTVFGTLAVDHAVDAALKFAYKHPNTLILVTGNHDTGGLVSISNNSDPAHPHYQYTASDTTTMPVCLYAVGPGSKKFSGLLDNVMIPRIISELWKLPASEQ